MDCFYHHAVPSVAPCRACRKPICASCRNDHGDCPGCVLAARIEAARTSNAINGGVGPSSGTYQEPQPEPQPQPQWQWQAAPPPRVRHPAALAVRPETRALVALSYPFWPLAIFALLDARAAHFVKRQAWQALGFNLGMYGLEALVAAAMSLPIVGFGAWPLLAFILPPLWVVASVVYAFRVWNGEDVDVPVVSDWIDARLPAEQN